MFQGKDSCVVRAYAKINLTLEVLSRRPDTYHEIKSIMQSIALYDTLHITAAKSPAITLSCNNTPLSNTSNLAYKAAMLLQQTTGYSRGANIELFKQVPCAAGLGGGSSDAAAVLKALNNLWGINLSVPELAKLAAQLGSDVPFFFYGGTALATGRGEQITQLPDIPAQWVVLLKPPVGIESAKVYSLVRPEDYSDGEISEKVINSLEKCRSLSTNVLQNVLEHSVLIEYPEVVESIATFKAAGAPAVRMSGSGSTLFTLCETLAQACDIYNKLVQAGKEAYLSWTLDAETASRN